MDERKVSSPSTIETYSSIKTILKIASNAVVCHDTQLIGEISIDEGCVVHPKSTIYAISGPIFIGKNTIIEEQVVIKNVWDVNATEEEKKSKKIMTIGSNNLIEVGAYIESRQIGNDNVIESKVRLLSDCVVGNGCILGSMIEIPQKSKIDDNSIIWGSSNQTDTQTSNETHIATHSKHLDTLRKILPNFHHLRKT